MILANIFWALTLCQALFKVVYTDSDSKQLQEEKHYMHYLI